MATHGTYGVTPLEEAKLVIPHISPVSLVGPLSTRSTLSFGFTTDVGLENQKSHPNKNGGLSCPN